MALVGENGYRIFGHVHRRQDGSVAHREVDRGVGESPTLSQLPSRKGIIMRLTAKNRGWFDMVLASMTRVQRVGLVDWLLDGGIDSAPIIEEPGKIKNAAWRALHAGEATVYEDESARSRKPGASQVETVRAYLKKIEQAYAEAFGEAFPHKVALTDGENGRVDLWRLA